MLTVKMFVVKLKKFLKCIIIILKTLICINNYKCGMSQTSTTSFELLRNIK